MITQSGGCKRKKYSSTRLLRCSVSRAMVNSNAKKLGSGTVANHGSRSLLTLRQINEQSRRIDRKVDDVARRLRYDQKQLYGTMHWIRCPTLKQDTGRCLVFTIPVKRRKLCCTHSANWKRRNRRFDGIFTIRARAKPTRQRDNRVL